jgi:hypothetical protein
MPPLSRSPASKLPLRAPTLPLDPSPRPPRNTENANGCPLSEEAFFTLPALPFRRNPELEMRSRRPDRPDVVRIFPALMKRYVRHHGATISKTPFTATAPPNSTEARHRKAIRPTRERKNLFSRSAEWSRRSTFKRFDACRETRGLARRRTARNHALRRAALQFGLCERECFARCFLVAGGDRRLYGLHGAAKPARAHAVDRGATRGLPNSFFCGFMRRHR